MIVDGKKYEQYAKITLCKKNPKCEEVLKALIEAGFSLIKSADENDNTLWYYAVKEEE